MTQAPETCQSSDSISSKPGSNGDQSVNVAELSAWLREEAHRAATFATRYQAASRFRAHWMDRSRKLSEAASALTASASEPEPVADDSRETCQRCQGNGEIVTDWERYRHPNEGDVGDEAVAECPDCNGVGSVTVPTPDGAVEATRDALFKIVYPYIGNEFTARMAVDEICAALSHPADGWRDIESAPKDETLFLAACPPDANFPDGRVMIWKGSILAFQNDKTPDHLRFPATHWRPLPAAPLPEGRG